MDPRRSDIAGIELHRRGLAVLVTTAAWAALYFAVRAAGSVDAFLSWVPLRCPLRLVTGLECPTCGLGHALVAAAVGDFSVSWRHHPMGLLSCAAILAGAIATAIFPRTFRTVLAGVRAFTARRAVVAVALLLYTCWGFARYA